MKDLGIPKVQLALTLVLISLSTLTQYSLSASLFPILLSVFFTVIFDLLFAYLRRKTLFTKPYAALVTGLIIGLIVDPNANFYQIAGISIIAMAAKNFLRVSNRHIFNPASIGLFIGGIIFGLNVSWWGVTFQNIRQLSLQSLILFLILLTPAYVSAYKLRRYVTILTFLIAYTILSHIFIFTFSINSIIIRLLDPQVLFFSLVMLPEPMTSPVNPKRQFLFGLFVAVFTVLLSLGPIAMSLTQLHLLPDLFIPALLLGNLMFFKYR